jgi:hypothetical protein
MVQKRALTLLLAGALALGTAACGDDAAGTPDSGVRPDSGGEQGDSGSDPVDSGADPVDSGGGPVDGGPPPPDYCPPPPTVGAAPSCPALASRPVVDLPAEITADMTLTCANTYRLNNLTYVSGATLTVEPGTHVTGLRPPGSGVTPALIVTTSGRLVAEGHPAAPIVFTSGAEEGERERGDFGGVVLLGLAPINVEGGTNGIEGIPAAETRGRYGGSDAAHDCGRLRYVRIEFAGAVLGEGNELNGLTTGGCGTPTVIDHVQVHRGLDDAFEFFGGTHDARYLVATGMDDDGLDWDLGYNGRIQHAIVQRYTDSNSGDPNGIEADSNRNANDAEPRSNPTVFNLTLIGTDDTTIPDIGAVIRRGSWGTIRNFILMGFSTGVDVRDASSINALGTGLVFTNGIFFDNTAHFAGAEEETPLTAAAAMNRVDVDPMLGAPYSPGSPSFVPSATSITATGGATPPSGGYFDVNTTYVGAIGPGCPDWTAGWTAYPLN